METLLENYDTPFYLYDVQAIVKNARELYNAFSWHKGFKNFFAVKATPTPFILKQLHDLGMGMDCSSYSELVLMERMGIRGEDICFTSNNTPAEDFKKALDLGAYVNLDDISLLDFLVDNFKAPELLCFRYNPGSLKKGNVLIGKPEEAKYGLTKSQLFEAYQKAKECGVSRFGLHTMVASNELDPRYFVETARMLFLIARELKKDLGITLDFINLGGGIGIPYRLEEEKVDFYSISKGIEAEYQEHLEPNGLGTIKLFMENGRAITGPYGYLVSKVLHKKDIYKNYVGLDACMSNLMRPAMYGAYHHITALGKEEQEHNHVYDITGGLCENNDKFAIDRKMPSLDCDDVVVIHDVGAHGHSMGFNYNGKLRSAEVAVLEDKTHKMIRRAETVDDYFQTMIF